MAEMVGRNIMKCKNCDSSKFRVHLLLFLLVVASTLLATGTIFELSAGAATGSGLIPQFLVNLPVCTAIAAINVWLIWLLHRGSHSRPRLFVCIVRDLLLTSVVAVAVPFAVNCLVMSPEEALVSSLAVIPWNWTVILMAEAFLYARERSRIEKEKAQYQYEALKSQVNPHFLFNCLNVLSSLVYQDADKANEFTKRLSKVYRYLLDTRMRQTVTVEEELAFVGNYLYLEAMRFDGRIKVSVSVDPETNSRSVIPASIQMLVENAFKHNSNTKESPLTLDITVEKDGVCVSNNIQPRNHVDAHGTGLGILRQQYALYGKQIEVSRSDDCFTVRLPFVGVHGSS